jgi:hypothetical protein
MTQKAARFNPGDNIPVFANSQVNAGRFISVMGGKTAQGDYPVQHAAAGTPKPFGVAERDSGPASQDSYSVERRLNCIRPGSVGVFVQVGEEVSALEEVAVGAGGKAIAVAAALLKTGIVGNNNAITFTARESGSAGNSLAVEILNTGKEKALSVDVDGDTITVIAATNGTGAGEITSTAAQVIAALAEHDVASQLVTAANTGASSGAGVVVAVAKTNLADGAGVAVGRFLTGADTDEFAECELY